MNKKAEDIVVENKIQYLKEKYKGNRNYRLVETVMASLERNEIGNTPKKIIAELNKFFPQHRMFIDDIKATLTILKVKT